MMNVLFRVDSQAENGDVFVHQTQSLKTTLQKMLILVSSSIESRRLERQGTGHRASLEHVTWGEGFQGGTES